MKHLGLANTQLSRDQKEKNLTYILILVLLGVGFDMDESHPEYRIFALDR